MSATVEVVVTNWRRPENVTRIVLALMAQSYPCKVTVVDGSGGSDPFLADNVYRVPNAGSINRYTPCFNYLCDYTLFIDDDLLPGRDMVRHFAEHAQARPRDLLGQHASMPVGHGGRKPGEFVPVDQLIMLYWVPRDVFPELMRFRHAMGGAVREDDIMLAVAAKQVMGRGIYLTPQGPRSEDGEFLPTPHAMCHHPDHARMRGEFWVRARAAAAAIKLLGR